MDSGFVEEVQISEEKVLDFIEDHKNLGNLGSKIWGVQDHPDIRIVAIYRTQEECNKGQAGR